MSTILTGKSLDSQLELLRHNIQRELIGKEKRPVTIAVTSCESGEGVTTVSTNLAACLAKQRDVEVLLIDGNTASDSLERRLAQGKIAGMMRMPGDTSPSTWPIQQISSNFSVLSSAKAKKKTDIDTFYSSANGCIERAKERFQFVVLDCPPIRRMFSSLHVFELVDGVILVVEAEKVRREVIEKEVSMLKNAGAKILGVVLNKRRFPIPKFLYRRL